MAQPVSQWLVQDAALRQASATASQAVGPAAAATAQAISASSAADQDYLKHLSSVPTDIMSSLQQIQQQLTALPLLQQQLTAVQEQLSRESLLAPIRSQNGAGHSDSPIYWPELPDGGDILTNVQTAMELRQSTVQEIDSLLQQYQLQTSGPAQTRRLRLAMYLGVHRSNAL
jgi:hypothetical protein